MKNTQSVLFILVLSLVEIIPVIIQQWDIYPWISTFYSFIPCPSLMMSLKTLGIACLYFLHIFVAPCLQGPCRSIHKFIRSKPTAQGYSYSAILLNARTCTCLWLSKATSSSCFQRLSRNLSLRSDFCSFCICSESYVFFMFVEPCNCLGTLHGWKTFLSGQGIQNYFNRLQLWQYLFLPSTVCHAYMSSKASQPLSWSSTGTGLFLETCFQGRSSSAISLQSSSPSLQLL